MDNASLSRAERLSLQARWLNAKMSGDSLWEIQHTIPRMLAVSENRSYVAWSPDAAGQPQIIDVLHATGLEASFTTGLTVTLAGRANSTTFKVSAHPREILPGLFAWLPAFCEFRFTPRAYDNPCGTWRATLPMLVRAGCSNARLTPITEFRAQWPDVSV
jgi:hypothetical protein